MLNWQKGKGEPYKIPEINYEISFPEVKILNEEELNNKYDFFSNKDVKFFKINFPLSFYLWRVCKLKEIETLNLITGVHYRNNFTEFDFITDFDDYPGEIDVGLEFEKPMYVYSSYPFEKMVEIRIKPIEATRVLKEKIQTYQEYNLGYILWQVSRVYEEIYKNRWEEIGVWGHIFSDLAFGSIKIYDENIIYVNLDS